MRPKLNCFNRGENYRTKDKSTPRRTDGDRNKNSRHHDDNKNQFRNRLRNLNSRTDQVLSSSPDVMNIENNNNNNNRQQKTHNIDTNTEISDNFN